MVVIETRQTPTASRIIASNLPTIIEPEQREWSYFWEDDHIAPFTCVEHEVYTVEEEKRLMLKGAMCSATSNTTGIASAKTMKIQLVISTPGFLGDRYFRRTDAITFAPSQEIKAGHTLYLYFYNLSSDEVKLTVNIIGVITGVTA